MKTYRVYDLPVEFYDILKVLEFGSKKYAVDSWRLRDIPSLQPQANHASMSRHLEEAYCGIRKDHESGLHPLLHLATRALMQYAREERGGYIDE
jgi:hypothetical protein